MSENTQGQYLLAEKDFVDVVDDETGVIVGSVPKHWREDQLAPGTSKLRAKAAKSGSSGSGTPAKRPEGVEPPKAGAGSSTEEWVAFAREKGATDADLVDEAGEPLKQAALIEKYGTPAS